MKKTVLILLALALASASLLVSCKKEEKQEETVIDGGHGIGVAESDDGAGEEIKENEENKENGEENADEPEDDRVTYDFKSLRTIDNSRYSIFTKDVDGAEKYGVVDIDGNVVVEPEYTLLGWCPEHRILYTEGEVEKRVELDDDYAIDTHFGHGGTGLVLWVYDNSQGRMFAIEYSEGSADVVEMTQLRILAPFVDYNGETPIAEGSYSTVREDGENFCIDILDGYTGTGLDFQYVTKEGNLVSIAGCTDVPAAFTDGVLSLCKDGKYGYITEDGEGASEVIYEEANTPFEGRAWVRRDGKYEVITLG